MFKISTTPLPAINGSRVLITALAFSLLFSFNAFSQDTTKTDREINQLNLNNGSGNRSILPHRLQPTASSGEIKDYNDSLNRAKLSISRTITNLNDGNLAMALFYVHDAIIYCPEKEVRTNTIALSYYGVIQVKLGNHSKAVTTLNKCDSVFNSIGDLNLIAFHNKNLGIFAKRFSNIKVADTYFNKSLALSRVTGDQSGIAETLNYLSQGDSRDDQKIAYLKEAIEINLKRDDKKSVAANYINMANVLASSGNYSDAFKYLDLSYEIVKNCKSGELLLNHYEVRSRVYALKGNYRQAYESLKLMDEIKGEFYNRNNIGDIEDLIQTRIIAKKNYELNLQRKELDIKRLNLSLTIAVSLFALTLLLSLYIYYVINSRRKLLFLKSKQALIEKEKEYIDNELVNVATYVNSRNEMLDNIQNSLTKAYKLPEKEIAAEIRKINMHIRNLQTKNEDVESVMNKIEKINKSFVLKLSEIHPDLTKNDKKIALLLRANLSTKQIATLMDCSPKSVNMARYRMRTHLNLNSDTNLVNYLKSL
ncbi:MAG: LuxR C-terminal-related transcriptional regulator [Bacteroidales bacterium]